MSDDTLREKIKRIIFINIEAGYSQYLQESYLYIKPSHSKYPFQWWWDTCFHIYILCSLGEHELAKENLRSLFAMQKDNGFVGHMIYWQRLLPSSIFEVFETKPSLEDLRPHMSSLIQPSFVAQVTEKIYQCTNDKKFVSEMLPKIKKYHQWVLKNRVFDKDGLIVIIAPVESGMDSKPSYDEVLGFRGGRGNWKLYWKWLFLELRNFIDRYDLETIRKADRFHVKDVGVNTINALDLYAVSRLSQIINDNEDVKLYKQLADSLSENIVEHMYDKKDTAFYDLCGAENKKLRTITPTVLFPLSLPDIPEEIQNKMVDRFLISDEDFSVRYPLPSVSKRDRSFVAEKQEFLGQDFLWRGPTWIFNNWFIFHSLKGKGFFGEASKLADSTKELLANGELREYYNPFNGKGYGAEDFTWAGLALDMNTD